jgi:hypothetical protein
MVARRETSGTVTWDSRIEDAPDFILNASSARALVRQARTRYRTASGSDRIKHSTPFDTVMLYKNAKNLLECFDPVATARGSVPQVLSN